MEITMEQFAKSYGISVKAVAGLLTFLMDKTNLGTDGKLGFDDLVSLAPKLVPMVKALDDLKIVAANAKMFLNPDMKMMLQTEFELAFDLPNDKKEHMIEEMHDIVLSIIKIIVKMKEPDAA